MFRRLTYGLRVDGMHGEEQRGDQGQSGVLKDKLLACVHEQAGHGAVQAHVDRVEAEGRRAVQQDVQPVETERGRPAFSVSHHISNLYE